MMQFKFLPQESVGGQDFAIREHPDIVAAAASLRRLFPTRHIAELVVIEQIDRDDPDVTPETYGVFSIGGTRVQ